MTKSQVEQGTFHAAGGGQNATFMTSKETYLKDGGAQGMLKYFRDGRLALAAVLPPAGTECGAVCQVFDRRKVALPDAVRRGGRGEQPSARIQV